MATSWFRFNNPGVGPQPFTNPLSYTQISGTPPFTASGTRPEFVFAQTQVINGVVRPFIDNMLANDINTAVSTGNSGTDVYLTNP